MGLTPDAIGDISRDDLGPVSHTTKQYFRNTHTTLSFRPFSIPRPRRSFARASEDHGYANQLASDRYCTSVITMSHLKVC